MYLPRMGDKALAMCHIAERLDVDQYRVCLTWVGWGLISSYYSPTTQDNRDKFMSVYELLCTETVETYHRTKPLMVNTFQVYLNLSI